VPYQLRHNLLYTFNSFRNTVVLSIVATDGGGHMGYANVTIIVNDVNDNAPVFTPPIYTFMVIEEQMGTFVGSVSANDMDYLQNGTVCAL